MSSHAHFIRTLLRRPPTMALLSPLELLGLYVLYGLHFLPIAIVFLMTWIRYSVYREQTRHTLLRKDGSLPPARDFTYFAKSDRALYDAHRRENGAVLPFAVYLVWMLVNAGLEAAGMFLVWYNAGGYPEWVYQTSMGLQFVIVVAKVVWLLSFFDVTSYRVAASAAAALLVLNIANVIIVVPSAPGRAYNWVLGILIVLFYLYTFLLMVHFFHMVSRGKYYHVHGWADKIDVFSVFTPPSSSRTHGVHVDRHNSRDTT